nr:uncharacterized protein LOC117864580 [Setaria viridis]
MEVLHRLLKKAVQEGVLTPPADTTIHHQCSIYTDDMMLFAAPNVQDITTIREVLQFFRNASGLHTNLQKSLMAPIAYSDEQVHRIQAILPVPVSEFPIQYLGLPLSVTRLKKSHLQPVIDKVSASIPIWKAPLMNKAGRLTTVKVWHEISGILNLQNRLPAQGVSLLDWWLKKRRDINALKRKGLDSAFMPISWKLWKERNDRVFNRSPAKKVAWLVTEISEEGQLCCDLSEDCYQALPSDKAITYSQHTSSVLLPALMVVLFSAGQLLLSGLWAKFI